MHLFPKDNDLTVPDEANRAEIIIAGRTYVVDGTHLEDLKGFYQSLKVSQDTSDEYDASINANKDQGIRITFFKNEEELVKHYVKDENVILTFKGTDETQVESVYTTETNLIEYFFGLTAAIQSN